MRNLALLGIFGFLAQLINGALGMGYGVTSTTALLMLGVTPALASATVNLSQVGSQLASGIAHWRFGNVDWALVWRIALPGAVGAFLGALLLSWLSTEAAQPLMSTILLALGGYILFRFTVYGTPRGRFHGTLPTGFLAPLGLIAGFLNSTGGGGWGPVGTSALLASGRMEPRRVIGSISAAEFAVVLAGSAGFTVGLGLTGINVHWVLVLLLGGVLAAPLAAWLARHVPARLLGSLVGGLLVLTNVGILFDVEWVNPDPPTQLTIYAVLLALWAAAVMISTRAHLRERSATAEQELTSSSA
ncbi:sulfite exporter TauE/SafE family protein [Lipingzhangella sp. LS1_29]|uniref:Probable membrane transporter protein n=1 Tax=Lipingzhangella rawalii TaxID=2055835 RepID=A0ABU2H391_9ACTN|nr:sulfite exporter TauE/SafE family protein [Lipingzhangella rawalii]MDS1269767.1 sulfite exporter TauE/SafE family protein [Lipingzhangella rawalii]